MEKEETFQMQQNVLSHQFSRFCDVFLTIMIFGNGVLLDSGAFNYRVTGDRWPSRVTGYVKLDL